MSLPFSDRGAQHLDEIVKPGMLCAFDFDGTLAPRVKDSDKACIPAAVLRRLIVLSEHARVAVITGRSVDDVSTRLDFMPDFIVGNHGIEGVPGWSECAESYRVLSLEWERQLAALVPGARIENKTYSLSVHYRSARGQAQAETRLPKLFARLIPEARVIAGDCVFDLLPPDAPDKSRVLRQLSSAAGARGAIYVGDGGGNVLTVRIKPAGDEAAGFHLPHCFDMLQLLDELIVRLTAPLVSAA